MLKLGKSLIQDRHIGQGLYYANSTYASASCLDQTKFELRFLPNIDSMVSYKGDTSYREVTEELGLDFSVEAKINLLIFSHTERIAVEYTKEIKKTERSSSFNLKFSLSLGKWWLDMKAYGEDILSKEALVLYRNDRKKFLELCGDSFVIEEYLSAGVYLTLKFNSKTRIENDYIKISGSGLLGLVAEKIDKAIKDIVKENGAKDIDTLNFDFSISAFESLGYEGQDDNSLLGFLKQNMGQDYKQCLFDLDRPMLFTGNCTQDAKVGKLVNDVLNYATSIFPDRVRQFLDLYQNIEINRAYANLLIPKTQAVKGILYSTFGLEIAKLPVLQTLHSVAFSQYQKIAGLLAVCEDNDDFKGEEEVAEKIWGISLKVPRNYCLSLNKFSERFRDVRFVDSAVADNDLEVYDKFDFAYVVEQRCYNKKGAASVTKAYGIYIDHEQAPCYEAKFAQVIYRVTEAAHDTLSAMLWYNDVLLGECINDATREKVYKGFVIYSMKNTAPECVRAVCGGEDGDFSSVLTQFELVTSPL